MTEVRSHRIKKGQPLERVHFTHFLRPMSMMAVMLRFTALLQVTIPFMCLWLLALTSLAVVEPSPTAHPLEIVNFIARFQIPRINMQNASLREVLDFIYAKYRTASIDPPPQPFTFEYRLSEATLRRNISLNASDVTIAQALKMALKDINVSLTFERGKLIFIEAPVERIPK